jgi:hypothetical protein
MVGHGSPNLRHSSKSSAITSDERRLTENGVSGAQLDLFEGSSTAPAAVTQPAAEPRVDVEALSEAELIGALSQAGLHESLTLVDEIARRRLVPGVPVLVALCRRHAGFSRSRVIPEQKAAIEALGIIGGRDASQALAELIARGAFEGPGLKVALQEAVRLASPLREPLVTSLLGADDPDIRAAAARCVRAWPKCAPLLIELLQDLHEDVRLAAACALGRIGNRAGRPVLLNALRTQPSRDVVEAIAGVPDEEVLVELGRTAEARQDLAGLIRNRLEDIDVPKAAKIAARIQS